MRKKGPKPNPRKDTSKDRRAVEKKKVSIPRVPRTRNAGTMTESQFFARIRSAMRQAFRWWKPMMKALEAASRTYQGPSKRVKKEYQCAHCENWFLRRQVEIDHREECGSLSCYDDIATFIQRLTREEIDAYQVLCRGCHSIKTKEYLKNKKVAA